MTRLAPELAQNATARRPDFWTTTVTFTSPLHDGLFLTERDNFLDSLILNLSPHLGPNPLTMKVSLPETLLKRHRVCFGLTVIFAYLLYSELPIIYIYIIWCKVNNNKNI